MRTFRAVLLATREVGVAIADVSLSRVVDLIGVRLAVPHVDQQIEHTELRHRARDGTGEYAIEQEKKR
jgi:hypothetical protein